MRHRHLSNSFPRFGIDQQDNNHTPVEHSYFPTGRGVAVPPENSPFIGQMNHHISRNGGVSHRLNLEGASSSSRANEYHHPPSNINMEIVQPLTPPFSHQPITDNRSLPPGGHVHPHYTNYNNVPNANPAHDMEAGSGPLNHHPTGKRKRSSSFNSLYTTASTSSSSQMPMELEKQTPPPFRGSLTIDGQDSSRNVRRRYRHDDMESESTNHIPNHFYQPTTSHPPPNYPSTPPVPHYPAPSPHIRLPPPDISGARHEMGQFHGGDSVFSRPSSQNLHGHHHHHNHHHGNNHTRSRIQSSYGNGSRYSHYAHGGTSSTNAPESFSSRNSRHCSPGGWRGSYRSGRPRIAVERFHSVVDVTESHNRIGHDTLMMVDRASFYGNSRNFSDQYRDLRLDIDNMSYEELLNLEERIGSVNTGLSEDSMSKFLKEKVYYSSDQHHEEEVSCPICLEEYKNGDNIGKMEKCGHGYHVDCIKKWLMMKKLCPICKTECSTQEPRVEG